MLFRFHWEEGEERFAERFAYGVAMERGDNVREVTSTGVRAIPYANGC
jgi:hypothetical protein